MNEKDFVSLCKKTVAEYANEHLDKTDGRQIKEDDIFIVWMCKTLQNSKALASTTLFDGMTRRNCISTPIRSGRTRPFLLADNLRRTYKWKW